MSQLGQNLTETIHLDPTERAPSPTNEVATPDSNAEIELAEDALEELEALEGAAASTLSTATAVVVASTPDVPSIMERMVRLQSERDAQDLALEELARRFENLEYQVS